MAEIDEVKSLEDCSENTRAKLIFFGNEFPNDDLKHLFRLLHRHSKDRRFRLLAAFIHETTMVIKDEISKLPQSLRDQVPQFDTILTLPEHGDFREGGLGAAMESALLVVLQLGVLIGDLEARDTKLDLIQAQTTLAGLSIGLFAGAAVALSTTLADLVKNGAEALRISFRLGVYVDDLSRKLEAPQPDGTLQSWAHVVTGLKVDAVQEELMRFNSELGGPELTKVFISAADKNSVSLSGPPSRLKAAFQHSHELRYSKSFALPVYDGLCHASHIYGQDDIEAILDEPAAHIPLSRPVQLSLLSSRSGKPFSAETAGELFHDICTELIMGTIYLDNVTDTIVSRIDGAQLLQVDTFRTSIVFKGIVGAIESQYPNIEISRHDILDWVHNDFGERRPSSFANSKLAIVGMSCRMPGGSNDLDEFWGLLEKGRDAHTTVPPDRFDLETHYDPTGKTENATQTQFGNFIDRPGYFDAGFFTMSPKEAKETDPMQRLALVTAYEAMERAGVVPGRTPSTRPDRIGTYYGQASDDWRELNASQNIGTYAVPGGVRGFATGRINYFFKFSGPSFNIDTACSSSMAAVHAGCSALWAGEADTVLAGGMNVITDPDNYAGLCNAHFLSKTGQCKVWDKDADGYCRADGIGSIVIKRLEDAEADNDNIIAVILSAATNHSAEAISITHPHAGAQRDNYRHVLHLAGVNPLDVSYVEMHGTGTQAGDAIESESVLDIFAPLTPRRRPDQHLHLGAVKANIGHGEAAAGISSLIKALLCFEKSQMPPHIGIKTEINPTIPKDLERRNAGLDFALTPWTRPEGKKRFALVNSFGAHGGNTTLLLEDAPERLKVRGAGESLETRPMHPITVSAKSKKSLQANLEKLLSYLENNPDTDIADLSYTLCGRRMHHPLRLATTVSSVASLQKFLRSSIDKEVSTSVWPVPSDAPSVVFTFTGQGASNRGVRQELFNDSPVFRTQVLQLDRLLQRLGFPSVIPAITGSSENDVDSPVTSQLSIVVLEIALARYWSLLGVRPSAVIGHSLGEYSALAVAGVISVADVLYLVGRRAQLTEKRCVPGSHGMLSVMASPADLESVLKSDPKTAGIHYVVSCRNTQQDTVVGGPKEDINTIRQVFESSSYKCVSLDIPFAFHTAQMDSVLDELEEMAEKVPFKPPSIPVLSTLLGSVVFDGKTINANYIRNQTRNAVNFADAVEAAQDLGMVDDKTLWLECGPHPVCVSFVRKLIPEARVAASCRRNEENMTTIAKSLITLHLGGVTPVWNEYFRYHESSYSLLGYLPKYSWNETNYWIPYIGTWTLDKALLKYGGQFLPSAEAAAPVPPKPSLRTSLIHQITSETIEARTATLHAVSDVQHPDFLGAVWGHKMNNCGVATSSIWTDMALTVGEYLYRQLVPQAKEVHMNVCDLEVLHAQVASKVEGTSQPLKLEAHLDLDSHYMSLAWFAVSAETGERAAESFASGAVRFEDPNAWRAEWDRVTHLVLGRIEALQQMASEGKASKLSKNMAYTLFKNVVDYADRYRGIDGMVLNDYEAYADITLSPERHGTYHTPPHWIDPVCHLAGLIMNGSDASNTQDYFYVTPGSDSFRLIKPLEAGAKYQSYSRMFPLPLEAGSMQMYAGDVYILQENSIVGILSQIRFRRVPRMLMDRFFSAPSSKGAAHGSHGGHATVARTAHKPRAVHPVPPPTVQVTVSQTTTANTESSPTTVAAPTVAGLKVEAQETSSTITPQDTPASSEYSKAEPEEADPSLVGQCLRIIASETNLELSDLTPDALFAQLGVDSLMSLVLSEKFRSELGVEIKSSLFLECPSIGDMKGWLEQNC